MQSLKATLQYIRTAGIAWRIRFWCIFLFGFFVIACLVGAMACVMNGEIGDITFARIITRGLLRWSGLRFTLLFAVLISFLVFFAFQRKGFINRIAYVDENGKRKAINPEALGGRRMMTLEKAKMKFDVSEDINEHFSMIFGYIDEKDINK